MPFPAGPERFRATKISVRLSDDRNDSEHIGLDDYPRAGLRPVGRRLPAADT